MYEMYLQCTLASYKNIVSMAELIECRVSELAVFTENVLVDKAFTMHEFVVLPKGSMFVVAVGNKKQLFELQNEGLHPFFIVDTCPENKMVTLPLCDNMNAGNELPNWKSLNLFLQNLDKHYKTLEKYYVEKADKYDRLDDVNMLIGLAKFVEDVVDDFEFGAGPDLF